MAKSHAPPPSTERDAPTLASSGVGKRAGPASPPRSREPPAAAAGAAPGAVPAKVKVKVEVDAPAAGVGGRAGVAHLTREQLQEKMMRAVEKRLREENLAAAMGIGTEDATPEEQRIKERKEREARMRETLIIIINNNNKLNLIIINNNNNDNNDNVIGA